MKEQNKYYVYRFKDQNDNIVYVGRTKNLLQRLHSHEQLDQVCKVEYIQCSSEAEMVWKEIYYINLYYNEFSRNKSDVYQNEPMKDIGLKDTWRHCWHNHVIDHENNYENFEKHFENLHMENYKELITIVDHEKLNAIGDSKYALSEKWFRDNPEKVKQLKNNVLNYFMNIIKDNDKNNKCLWITYPMYYDALKGKGYTKGYYYRNSENIDRVYLAYLENNFIANNSSNNQDAYALSHLLSFLFQSGIRDGKRITVYIPSSRMRSLLENWIEEQNYKEE